MHVGLLLMVVTDSNMGLLLGTEVLFCVRTQDVFLTPLNSIFPLQLA